MYVKVEKPKENKSRAVTNSVGQKKNDVKQNLGFVDNRSEAITQWKLKEMANDNQKESHMTLIQKKSNLKAYSNEPAIQLGKGKKTTDDYVNEYIEDEMYREQASEDMYYDMSDIERIDYAWDKLEKCNYNNWCGIEAVVGGNYVRFIWNFEFARVGLNVHYPIGGGKAAGHMYIQDVNGYQANTPQQMVANAPNIKPGTTETWY